MPISDRERYDMLIRVRNFGTEYGQLFPQSSLARQALADLTSALDEVQAQRLVEKRASISARAARTTSTREALNERLVKIAATARVISETNSDLGEVFGSVEASTDQQLLTTAHEFARNAAPYTAAFVAHGMPPTFVTDLQASIEAFDRALLDRGTGRNGRTVARVGIRAAMAAARAAVRKLDVIVANYTGLDAKVRAVWERERRVSPPRAKRKTAEPARMEEKPVGSAAVEEKAA